MLFGNEFSKAFEWDLSAVVGINFVGKAGCLILSDQLKFTRFFRLSQTRTPDDQTRVMSRRRSRAMKKTRINAAAAHGREISSWLLQKLNKMARDRAAPRNRTQDYLLQHGCCSRITRSTGVLLDAIMRLVYSDTREGGGGGLKACKFFTSTKLSSIVKKKKTNYNRLISRPKSIRDKQTLGKKRGS